MTKKMERLVRGHGLLIANRMCNISVLITDRLSVGMTEGQLFESSPGVCMHHVVSLERTLSYFTLPLSTQGDKMCCVLRQDT